MVKLKIENQLSILAQAPSITETLLNHWNLTQSLEPNSITRTKLNHSCRTKTPQSLKNKMIINRLFFTPNFIKKYMISDQDIIDIRTDSLTKAPQGMLEAMSKAALMNNQEVNSFEDIGAKEYEHRLANIFGKEGAIIFPTRIMANNAAVFLHAKQGSEVVIASNAHAVQRQHGSFVRLVGVQTRQIFSDTGIFTVQQAKERIRKEKQHFTFPDTDLVFVQNPTSRGVVWPIEQLRSIKKMAEQLGVKVHIDGTRMFNALAHYQLEPKDIRDCYDTMYVCFEKGLCCPVGGAILGSKSDIQQLFLIRKGLGGGFFNNGIIAEAESYALQHLLPLVKEDNSIAFKLASQLSLIPGIVCRPAQTHINTVHWSVSLPNFSHSKFSEHLLSKNIKIKPWDQDQNQCRFSIYNRIRQPQTQFIAKTIRQYFKSLTEG